MTILTGMSGVVVADSHSADKHGRSDQDLLRPVRWTTWRALTGHHPPVTGPCVRGTVASQPAPAFYRPELSGSATGMAVRSGRSALGRSTTVRSRPRDLAA